MGSQKKKKKAAAVAHRFVFSHADLSFSVRLVTRGDAAECWRFYDDAGETVGALTAIRDVHRYWHVDGSFTSAPEPKKLLPYLVLFLETVDITEAFISVFTGGTETISADFKA